jgi:hypothetical protein
MTSRILVTAVTLATLLAVSGEARSSTSGSGAQLVKTDAPVTGLAVDRSVVAVATPWPTTETHHPCLSTWNPRRASVLVMWKGCGGVGGQSGIDALGVAGKRLAWVRTETSTTLIQHLITATVDKRHPRHRLADGSDSGDTGVGDYVGNVQGDRSLLVFNTWSTCYTAPNGAYRACPPGVPKETIYTDREKLWRIVGDRKRLIASAPNELAALAVAAGRILVKRHDGSLELRRADGHVTHKFRFRRREVRAALLDASELVVLDHRAQDTWRVYDPATGGGLKRVLPARRGATPADVERGLVVYVIHRQVHVLRLTDGPRGSSSPGR